MNGRVNMTCRQPGDFNGKKPKRIEGDRRCPCGTKLMPYNPESLCSVCQRNPRPPKEIVMEPEVWTTKQVKDHLGLERVGDVRDLEDAGKITLASTGRGRWGRKYLADSVLAYHDGVTLDRFADAAFDQAAAKFDVEQADADPEKIAERVAAAFGDEPVRDEPECPVVNADDCCGQPESCVHTSSADAPDEPVACSCGDDECCPSEPEPEGARVQFGGGAFWIGPVVDPEIEAMDQIRKALDSLDNEQRIRAVEWAIQRFQIRRGTTA